MISVIVLGTGNVGTHLINTFLNNPSVELRQVYSRRKSSLKPFINSVATTTSIDNLKEANVYIIAISDDSISKFSSQLRGKDRLVVHTSGSASLNALKNKGSKGVFYPLQTFSKNYTVDFSTVPICIETERDTHLILLEKLASSVSEKVYIINSEQRKRLHIAAVFTNNFVNHLYKIGFDICEEQTIPLETLYPLITETARKIVQAKPSTIQTGPAYRNDVKTINSHLELLSGENKKIYQLLTKSIQKTYGEKL